MWRIPSFPIHDREPNVVHLAVHLENGQCVHFDPNNIQLCDPHTTTPTAHWFLQFVEYWWLCCTLRFRPTTHGTIKSSLSENEVEGLPDVRKSSAISQIYTVHMNDRKCFYFQLLLHHVKGPIFFQTLITEIDCVHPDYQLSCKALGHLSLIHI